MIILNLDIDLDLNIKLINKMIRKFNFYLICIIIISFKTVFCQEKNNYFGERLFVNINATHLRDKIGFYHKYDESSLNLQASMRILRSIYVGVDMYTIFTNGTSVPPRNYFIKGGFIRYEFIQKRKYLLFINMAMLTGDYCTCGNLDPYRKKGLSYLGIEFGGNIFFRNSSFYINTSLSLNRILNNIHLKYNYNLPKLGIGYSFGRKIKSS